MSFDFKIDYLGDGYLELTNYYDVVPITDNLVSLAQRVVIRLRTYLGEWQFDVTYGTPYRESIIGSRKQREIDAVLITEIFKEPGVVSVEDFKSSFDESRRLKTVSFTLIGEEGSIQVRFPVVVPDTIPTVDSNVTYEYDRDTIEYVLVGLSGYCKVTIPEYTP